MQKGEVTHIELHKGQTQAPYICCVPVVVSTIRIRVEAFGTHVSARADVGIAGIKRPAHDLTHSEVRDLHFHFVVHQQIRRFYVSVHDLVGVKVIEAVKHLFGYARQ